MVHRYSLLLTIIGSDKWLICFMHEQAFVPVVRHAGVSVELCVFMIDGHLWPADE